MKPRLPDGGDIGLAAHMAWFLGQYLLTRRFAGPITAPGEPDFRASTAMPGPRRLVESILRLVAEDRKHVKDGLLPPHNLALPDPRQLIGLMRRYLADLDRIEQRRLARQGREVNQAARRGRYPNYYLQNFHYQTDGYLSTDSAELYDWQVETLFGGTAKLMRRRALVPIANWLRHRDQRSVRLLDIGCGTGVFLAEIHRAFPRLNAFGLDLSRPYLEYAARNLRPLRGRRLIEAVAEQLPIGGGQVDLVTSVYLLHEVPPLVRTRIVSELARIMAPGGRVVIVDSLQLGDNPEMDGLLEAFPVAFHEPYYASWTRHDIASDFSRAGLVLQDLSLAHLSKVMVFRASDAVAK